LDTTKEIAFFPAEFNDGRVEVEPCENDSSIAAKSSHLAKIE
jgi:hypothetical protein